MTRYYGVPLRNSVGLGLGGIISLSSGQATPPPESLFQNGEQGAWYDPSDNTTMFQEAGGKTPVTAVEQAVGLILDKSVPTQATGYYSGAFDGSSDLLSFADNVALQMGTGDFTIEFWINFASISGFQTPYEKSYTDVGGLLIQTGSGTGRMIVYASNVAVITETGTGVVNTWIHYALVRNSGTLKLYRDGVETGSVANATNFNGTGTGGIGARSLNGNFSVNGYMSNVRVVKGTAVYTAPFTPPTTPLTAISGTSLLALQNNRFIDNSANAFTLNVSGNPGVNLFNPFNSTPARMVNNAYQFTSASRPTLRARYNLLERSEEFADAYWGSSALITSNVAVAPNGTSTADKLTPSTVLGGQFIGASATSVAGVHTYSLYAKADGYSWIILYVAGPNLGRFFNVSNGTIGSVFVGAPTSSNITPVGNGWFRCEITVTSAITTPTVRIYGRSEDNQGSFAGDGTSGILIWGAQLTQTAVFPSNVYQRIAAATDYATGAAFPQYLSFDGTDDSLLTANVDFATVTSDGAARRNLLLNPTQFDAAGWTKIRSSVTANATAAPDGSTTADKLVEDTSTGTHFVDQSVGVAGETQTYSVYAKPDGRNFIYMQIGNSNFAYFDISTGIVGTVTGAGSVATIQNVGNGWFRCILTAPRVTSQINYIMTASSNGVISYAGDGTSGIFLWGAQLETGSTATAFQNIGTNKMTVFSGLSKLSDATTAAAVELSASSTSNNGTFAVFAPNTAADYGWRSRGTISVTLVPSGYASPRTNVVTGIGDLAAPLTQIRINGSIATTDSSTSPGTGNYLSYPLYIGRRNNASLPFNGRIYSLIVCGANFNNDVILQTESYVASKTPLGSVP